MPLIPESSRTQVGVLSIVSSSCGDVLTQDANSDQRTAKCSVAQIRLRIEGPSSSGSGGQTDLVDGVRLSLDFLESFLEIIFGVFPFERLCDLVVEGLKLKY